MHPRTLYWISICLTSDVLYSSSWLYLKPQCPLMFKQNGHTLNPDIVAVECVGINRVLLPLGDNLDVFNNTQWALSALAQHNWRSFRRFLIMSVPLNVLDLVWFRSISTAPCCSFKNFVLYRGSLYQTETIFNGWCHAFFLQYFSLHKIRWDLSQTRNWHNDSKVSCGCIGWNLQPAVTQTTNNVY